MKNVNCLCVVALMVACAGEPTINTAADAELSFDGLSSVNNSRFANAWADPDVDFAVYNKIIVGDAEFEFRAVKQNASTSSMRHGSETIYRAVDRRKMEQAGTGIRANSVTTWFEVRRLARRWATTLVEGLDAIHE